MSKRGRPRKLPPIEKELNKYPFSGVNSMEDLMKLLNLDNPRQAHMAELSHTQEICQKEGCFLYQLQDNRQKCAFHQRSWYPKPRNALRRFRGNFCVHRSFLAVASNTKVNAIQRGCACNDPYCIGIGNAPFGSIRFPLNRAKLDVALRFMAPVLDPEKIAAIIAHPKSYFIAPWHFWPQHRKIVDTENEFIMKVDTQQETYFDPANPTSCEQFIFPPPTYSPKQFYEVELPTAPYLRRFRFDPLVLPSWVTVYQTLEAKAMKVEHDQRQIAKRQKLLDDRRLEKEREEEKRQQEKQGKEQEKLQREQERQQREQERQQERAKKQKEKEAKKKKDREYKELERLLGKERAKELSEFERELIRNKLASAETKSPTASTAVLHPQSMVTTFSSMYPPLLSPSLVASQQQQQQQQMIMQIPVQHVATVSPRVSPQVALQAEAQQVVAQVAQRLPASPSTQTQTVIPAQTAAQAIQQIPSLKAETPPPPLLPVHQSNAPCPQSTVLTGTGQTGQVGMAGQPEASPSSSPDHTDGSVGDDSAAQEKDKPISSAVRADKDIVISKLKEELRQVRQALTLKTELHDLSQSRLAQRELELRQLKDRMLGLAHSI